MKAFSEFLLLLFMYIKAAKIYLWYPIHKKIKGTTGRTNKGNAHSNVV